LEEETVPAVADPVARAELAELVGRVVREELVDRGELAEPENPEELVGLVE
jgi:hypothetical protein